MEPNPIASLETLGAKIKRDDPLAVLKKLRAKIKRNERSEVVEVHFVLVETKITAAELVKHVFRAATAARLQAV